MSKEEKTKMIQKLLEKINDETVLNQVMEDVEFYASSYDIVDRLSSEQLAELDRAIEEADKSETISLDEFKKQLGE